MDAGGLTDSAMILAGRTVIDVTGGGADPGEFLGNSFLGYNEEAVLFSFSFHDFGTLCSQDGICGYENHWHFDTANDFGSGLPFYFDPANLPGESFPSIHEDSSIVLDGVGTLYRWDHAGGTLDAACNCKVN
jgi:hypothetical protein